mmetsp:Transcript_64292/g.188117  ORF Transcript_64292/g.188117 Transcript_64292/m.188117 type:complete len:84 (+) Transcript_64292:84-335(+)
MRKRLAGGVYAQNSTTSKAPAGLDCERQHPCTAPFRNVVHRAAYICGAPGAESANNTQLVERTVSAELLRRGFRHGFGLILCC